MNITYQLISTSGNPTAIISGKYTSQTKRVINQQVFASNKLVEQIGYVYQIGNDFYFEMMGNEFSGNGCRAASFVFLKGKPGKISFISSGINTKINGYLKNNNCSISMPLPNITFYQTKCKYFSTNIFGTFMIFSDSPIDNKNKIIQEYSSLYPAVGLMEYSYISQKISINPWFWVKNTNKLINESACGSGSIGLTKLLNLNRASIVQPSGQSLEIILNNNSVTLSGKIELLNVYNVKINL